MFYMKSSRNLSGVAPWLEILIRGGQWVVVAIGGGTDWDD